MRFSSFDVQSRILLWFSKGFRVNRIRKRADRRSSEVDLRAAALSPALNGVGRREVMKDNETSCAPVSAFSRRCPVSSNKTSQRLRLGRGLLWLGSAVVRMWC